MVQGSEESWHLVGTVEAGELYRRRLHPPAHRKGRPYQPHLTGRETEAQRG